MLSFRPPFTRLACAVALCAATLPWTAWGDAGESSTRADDDKKINQPGELSRIPGLFDVDLPDTTPRKRLRVSVAPHFGDFLHRDYVRIPVGFRYGLNDRTELNAEVDSYFNHGLKGDQGEGCGLSALALGGKYEWQDWMPEDYDTSTGLNIAIPVGRPPIDLTDGHYHISPYVVFTRHVPWAHNVRPFITVGADLTWRSNVPGDFGRNQPHHHSASVSPGVFWDRGAWKYTFVCTYTTTVLFSQEQTHIFSLNPSVLWELPPELKFHSRSQWIVGAGLHVTVGPDGTDISTSSRLHAEFRLSRLIGSVRPRSRPLYTSVP